MNGQFFRFVLHPCDQNLVTSTCRTAGLSLANLSTHNGRLVLTNEQTGISWTGATVLSVWSVNLWEIWNSEEGFVWMCEPFDEMLLPASAFLWGPQWSVSSVDTGSSVWFKERLTSVWSTGLGTIGLVEQHGKSGSMKQLGPGWLLDSGFLGVLL